MEEKVYDKNLGKYVITGISTKDNKEVIKSITYKDLDIDVSKELKEVIKDLNNKILELENSIAHLTEERRKKITKLSELKENWNKFKSVLNIEYEKLESKYTYYEDLTHKKALIQ